MTNAREFNRQVTHYERHTVEEEFVRFHTAVCLDLLRGVVLDTRVDTGRARGGWQLSVNSPPTGETGRADRGGGSTIQAGEDALRGLEAFVMVWLANLVNYVYWLNYGTDKTAGDFMVERNIQRVEHAFAGGIG